MNGTILWIDDQIDMLRPHIAFLTKKGYAVETINNGVDAVELCKSKKFDIFLLTSKCPELQAWKP